MRIESVTFYLMVIGLSSFLGIIYQYFKKKKLNILAYTFYSISFLIVWLVSGLRYGIGTDYFMYKDIFEYVVNGGTISQTIERFDIEPGWSILNYIVSIISSDSQSIFIVSSFIFTFCIYKTILYYQDRINVGLAIFIFLTVMYIPSFNAVRQYIAIGILMFSLRYIESKNTVKFLAIVAIATSFHYTSIIFIPVYYLVRNKIGVLKAIVMSILIIVGLLNYNIILGFIISIVPSFEKYGRYASEGNFNLNTTLLLFQISMIFLIIKSYSFLEKKDMFFYKITYMYYASIIFSMLGNMVNFAGRMAYYLEISQMLFIPFICKIGVKKMNKVFLNSLIIIYYIIYWYLNFIYSRNHGSFPYIRI